MSYTVTISSNAEDIGKAISDMVRKQIPYATAQAVNALAKQVKLYEQKNLLEKFPSATPFTVSSVSMTYAKKTDPTATVFMKPIATNYMRPYEEGGRHWLGQKKGLLVPKGQPTNTYGNLPERTIEQLKGRGDVFAGSVKTKHGKVRGIWQRSTDPKNRSILQRKLRKVMIGTDANGKPIYKYTTDQGRLVKAKNINVSGKLKLLIRFSDSPQVEQELNWGHMAEATVRSRWRREFEKELAKALKTAK